MPVLICLTSTIPGLRCCETLQSAGSGQGGHLQAPKDILKGFMKHKTFTWIWYLGLGREQKPGTRCSLQTAAGPRINSTISIALRFSSIENYDPSFCNTPLLLKWKQNRKWRFVFIFFSDVDGREVFHHCSSLSLQNKPRNHLETKMV